MMLRAFCFLLGLVSCAWTFAALPSFSRGGSAHEVSERILVDDRFKREAMEATLEAIKSQSQGGFARAGFAQDEAIISTRVSELAPLAKSSAEADRSVEFALEMIRTALSLNPGNSYLWLLLYSAEVSQAGVDSMRLKYLSQSYATGAREGWVSGRRNRMALAIFLFLPVSVQDEVVSEFAGLVDANLLDEAVAGLTTVGWSYRDRLLAGLGSVEMLQRESLSRRLSRDGIKVDVPGVNVDDRPWR